MANANSWIAHFEKMARGTLPPGSRYIIRNRGGGATRSYYRVNPTIISPAQQVVNQAEVKVKHVKGPQGFGVIICKRTGAKAKPRSETRSKSQTKPRTKAKTKLQTNPKVQRKLKSKSKAKPKQ